MWMGGEQQDEKVYWSTDRQTAKLMDGETVGENEEKDV